MIKLSLTRGSTSFVFEGKIEDALVLLASYWSPIQETKAADEAFETAEQQKIDPTLNSPKRPKKPRASNGSKPASASTHAIDAQSLANKIKTDNQFSIIKEKILDVKGDWLMKCKMVAYFANESITSGDVKRTLDALRIKSSLPTLSKTLSSNSDKFLTKGERPEKYELTSAAEESFKKSLVATPNG